MSEEMKVEEMELVTNANEEVLDTYEDSEVLGGGVLGKVLVGALITGAGLGAAYLCKNRGKLDEWRIKKLEKKGYQVYKADEVYEDDEYFDEENSDVTEK